MNLLHEAFGGIRFESSRDCTGPFGYNKRRESLGGDQL